MAVSREEWEQAEVVRSSIEARLAGPRKESQFLADHNNCGRYMSPPGDTSYPLEYAYHLLGDVAGKTVVDYGCGDGENCLVLAARGAHVKAVDISPDLIGIAKRRIAVNRLDERVEFIVGSAYEVPVSDASVDLVFGIAILHHLDLPQAAREVWRILKPGGRAIFEEPVRNLKLIRWIRSLIPYQAPDVSPFERPLTDSELADFGAQFSSYRSKPFILVTTSVLNLFAPLQNLLGESAQRVDMALLRRIPWLRNLAAVRVIELTK